MRKDILMLWQRLPQKILLLVVLILLFLQHNWSISSGGHFSSLIGIPLFLLTISLSFILLTFWLIIASRYALKLPAIVTLLSLFGIIIANVYLWHAGYSFYPNVILLTLAILSFGLVLSAYYSHHKRIVSWITAILIILLIPFFHHGMRDVFKVYFSGEMEVTLPANQYHSIRKLNIPVNLLGDKLQTDKQRQRYILDFKQQGVINKILLAKNATTISSSYYPDDWLLELFQQPSRNYHQLSYYAGDQLPELSNKHHSTSSIIQSHKSQTDLFLPILKNKENQKNIALEFIFSCDRSFNTDNENSLKSHYKYCIRYPLSQTRSLFAYSYQLKASELSHWQEIEAKIHQKLNSMLK